MKKLIAILIAIVLVATIGAGVVLASGNSNEGQPADKTSVGIDQYDVTTLTNTWQNVPGLTDMVIHTSSQVSLEVALTAEAALITDVKISSGKDQSSKSWAGLTVRALIDSDDTGLSDTDSHVALPGDVVLNYREMQLTGTLWGPDNFPLTPGLDTQYIDIYESTRSANGFNFFVPYVNAGPGYHTITIQAKIDTGLSGDGSIGGAILGKRTCFIQAEKLASYTMPTPTPTP